jgi:electron transport complex protein RnfE
VNCIILARAEAFAAKNKPLPSVLDGIAMGLGFTVALFFISAVREILGNGSFLGIPLFGDHFEGASLITMAPGGFIVFGTLIAVVQYLKNRRKKEVL